MWACFQQAGMMHKLIERFSSLVINFIPISPKFFNICMEMLSGPKALEFLASFKALVTCVVVIRRSLDPLWSRFSLQMMILEDLVGFLAVDGVNCLLNSVAASLLFLTVLSPNFNSMFSGCFAPLERDLTVLHSIFVLN